MHFIPRNNVIYQYIAHTNTMRRYCATLFLLIGFGSICFYAVYVPLKSHILLYKSELARLQRRYEDGGQLSKNTKELSAVIFEKKKHVNEHARATDHREKECSDQTQFVFDTMAVHGLTLNVYGSCKEKDKKWYTKEISHCQAVGSMQNVSSFIKTIKDSNRMVRLSHVGIVRVKDNLFQLDCDIEIILVKSA